MPPGIGQTGLGSATATININTSQLKIATGLARTLGQTIGSSMNQATNAINGALQVQKNQTAIMQSQVGVINANIAAQKLSAQQAMVTARVNMDAAQAQVNAIKEAIKAKENEFDATNRLSKMNIQLKQQDALAMANKITANQKQGTPPNQADMDALKALNDQIAAAQLQDKVTKTSQAGQIAALKQKMDAQQKVVNQLNEQAQQEATVSKIAIQAQQDQVNAIRQTIAARQQQAAQDKAATQAQIEQSKQLAMQYQHASIAMAAMGIGAAKIVNTGISEAGYIETQGLAFGAMLKNEQKGVDLMEHLRDTAIELRVPLNDMVEATRIMLPTLEGNTSQLDQQLRIMRRVATLNPAQGFAGAAFATNEALITGGSDLKSLANRFNLPRALFHENLERDKHDFWKALDDTLNKMGITEQMANDVGNSYVSSFKMAGDSAKQLLAAGFTPLITFLTPKLQMFTEWVNGLRQTQKEALGIAAAVTGIVALSVPVLYFITRWAEALRAIIPVVKQIVTALKTSTTLQSALVYGTAAVGGAVVGKYIGNRIQEARGEKPSDWSDMLVTFKQLLFTVTSLMTRTVVAFTQGIGVVIQGFHAVSAVLHTFMADIKGLIGMDATSSVEAAKGSWAQVEKWGKITSNQNADKVTGQMLKPLYDTMFPKAKPQAPEPAPEAPLGGRNTKLSFDQEGMISDYFKQLDRLAARNAEQMLESEQDFQEQRLATVTSHNRDLLREQEDFDIQRAREEQDYQASIASIQRDLGRQIEDMDAALNDNIAKERRDSNKKLAEDEKKYQEDRIKAEKDHKDRLIEAAINFDAKAVWQEQRSYEKSKEEAKKAHDEQIKNEKDTLNERISDEIAANEKSKAMAQRDAARRLEDMAADFTKRKALEDADRALRLSRQQADYEQQLTDMDTQNAKRTERAQKQYAQELADLEDSFRSQLSDGGIFGDAWLKNQDAWQAESLKRFYLFFQDIANGLTPASQAPDPNNPLIPKNPKYYTPFATGGFVKSTGLALLHKNETVVPAGKGPGGSGKSIHFAANSINIHPSQGMDENKLGDLVVKKLVKVLEEIA